MSTLPNAASDFSDFALKLSAAKSVREVLQLSVETFRDALGADIGGAMMVVKRHIELAWTDSDIARRADGLQLELETGPCLEAIADSTTFIIADTAEETRWQPWCRAVAEMGIRSVVATRLTTLDGTIGSLNLYHYEPDRFSHAEGALAQMMGPLASTAVAAARTEEGLRDAMQGRHVIGLAQGILMERFGLDEDASFSVLRRYSQDLNLKLRSVAQEFVENRTLPSLDPSARARDV